LVRTARLKQAKRIAKRTKQLLFILEIERDRIIVNLFL